MNSNLSWYAVYTKPCWEKKVSQLLTENGIENYCPLQKIQRRWSDRKKIIMEPVFKSYVFVRIPKNGHTAVRQVNGILNFVNYLGKPAVIRDEEILIVKQFLSEYTNIRLDYIDFAIKDHVRVISGPFMSMEGDIVQVRNKTVTVLLPSLGLSMSAEIEKGNLINTCTPV